MWPTATNKIASLVCESVLLDTIISSTKWPQKFEFCFGGEFCLCESKQPRFIWGEVHTHATWRILLNVLGDIK